MAIDRTRIYYILDEDNTLVCNIHINYEINEGDAMIIVTMANGHHAYQLFNDVTVSENCSFGNTNKIVAQLLLQCAAAGEIKGWHARIIDAASDVICERSLDIIDRLNESGFKVKCMGSSKSVTV